MSDEWLPAYSKATATPVMFAVWGGNVAAINALISQGTDMNAASKLVASISSTPMPALFDISITPMAEAKRLQLTEVQAALLQAGAQATVKAKARTF